MWYMTLLELSRLLEGVVSGDFGGWKHEITLMQVACFLILSNNHIHLCETNNIHVKYICKRKLKAQV